VPYLGQDGYCNEITQKFVTIASYVNVTSAYPSNSDFTDLMDAVANVGPISISIDASVPDFYFYASGIYDNSICASDPNDLDHSVLLVG
jgi:hypothetical protein